MKLSILLITVFSLLHLTETTSSSNAFSCKITSDKSTYKLGEIPKIDVRLINESKKSIYLIGSLDGSEEKKRMPFCYFNIKKPKADPIRFDRSCGNMNTLRVNDFIKVKPGQAMDPYQDVDSYGFFTSAIISTLETFRNPGEYEIQFVYCTTGTELKKYSGDFNFLNPSDTFAIKKLLEMVPKTEVHSNILHIKIEPADTLQ